MANGTCPMYALRAALTDAQPIDAGYAPRLGALAFVPYALLAGSLVVAGAGHRILRPVVAFAGLCVGGATALHVRYEYFDEEPGCTATSVATALASLLTASLATYVLKATIVLLGAAAGGAAGVFLFDTCGAACDVQAWTGSPRAYGRSAVFWLATAAMASVGGLAAHKRRRQVLIGVTAVVGAWGSTVALRMLFDDRLSSSGASALFAGLTALSCAAQAAQHRRQARHKSDSQAKVAATA